MTEPSSPERSIGTILVVDDERTSRQLLERILRGDGHHVVSLQDGEQAIAHAEQGREYDLVISDIRMAGADGLDVLGAFRGHAADTPVLLVTAFGHIDGAIEAIQRGAYDYISKPYDIDGMRLTVDRALTQRRLTLENRALRRGLAEKSAGQRIVGQSPVMLEVYKMVARVGQSDVPVLVEGESGSGKELVARTIHDTSPRSSGPFIAVNCGGLAEGVLESELFGHVRGAFTGASVARRGLIEEARHGALFLDEIATISPKMQTQLLRVLQEGELRRVGSNELLQIDARFIAASNADLTDEVAAGRFREDLFFRLNVVQIRIPPLRERREDIPLLVEHFLARSADAGPAVAVSPDAMAALEHYDWPGNVRELQNAVARALALTTGGVILPEHLPPAVADAPRSTVVDLAGDRPPLAELTRRYAELVLAEQGGNKSRAAQLLGIDRKTLSRLLQRGDD